MDDELKFSLQVYEDYALITGFLTSDILKMLIKLCEEYGFTHIRADGSGRFKLVRKDG